MSSRQKPTARVSMRYVVIFRSIRLTHVGEEDVVVVRDVPVLGRESGVAGLDCELF